MEGLALLLQNGVVFRNNHFRLIFKMAALRFVDVSEEEIITVNENTIPKNTKHEQSSESHFYKVRSITKKPFEFP